MKKTLFLLLLIFFIESIVALDLGKINLPNELKVGEDILQINGAGWRKKFIIKVYAGALYLMEKNNDPTLIIAADETAAIRMHFVYDGVSPDKLVSAWLDGFERAETPDSLNYKIDEFNGWFTESADKNDIYDIIYTPESGISLYINDELTGTIPGLEFKKAVFSIWLGENTSLAGLKDKMLGN